MSFKKISDSKTIDSVGHTHWVHSFILREAKRDKTIDGDSQDGGDQMDKRDPVREEGPETSAQSEHWNTDGTTLEVSSKGWASNLWSSMSSICFWTKLSMRLRYVRLVRRPIMPSPYGLFWRANSFFTGTAIFWPRCWWFWASAASSFSRTLGWIRQPSFPFRHPLSKGLDGGNSSRNHQKPLSWRDEYLF